MFKTDTVWQTSIVTNFLRDSYYKISREILSCMCIAHAE